MLARVKVEFQGSSSSRFHRPPEQGTSAADHKIGSMLCIWGDSSAAVAGHVIVTSFGEVLILLVLMLLTQGVLPMRGDTFSVIES